MMALESLDESEMYNECILFLSCWQDNWHTCFSEQGRVQETPMTSYGLSWLLERVWGDWEAALFSELEVGEGRGCKESSRHPTNQQVSADLIGLLEGLRQSE